jgi:chromosome segregation ATPase
MRQSTFRVPRLLPGSIAEGRMTVSEQALDELRTRLERVLGPEEAATLMDHLPPDRAATKADLEALERTSDDRFGAVDRRFDAVDRKFDAVDRRFDEVDRKFVEVEHRFTVLDIRLEELEKRLNERIDARSEILEHRVLGALSGVREDFATQLNVQTRISVFSTISALITLAALTLTLSGA